MWPSPLSGHRGGRHRCYGGHATDGRQPIRRASAPGGSWDDVDVLIATAVDQGAPVRPIIDPDIRGTAPDLVPSVHRIIAESLTNVSRHVRGVSDIEVAVRLRTDRLVVIVQYDGEDASPRPRLLRPRRHARTHRLARRAPWSPGRCRGGGWPRRLLGGGDRLVRQFQFRTPRLDITLAYRPGGRSSVRDGPQQPIPPLESAARRIHRAGLSRATRCTSAALPGSRRRADWVAPMPSHHATDNPHRKLRRCSGSAPWRASLRLGLR